MASFGRSPEQLQKVMKILAEDNYVDFLVFFPSASQVEYVQAVADNLVAVSQDVAKPVVLCIWTAGDHL